MSRRVSGASESELVDVIFARRKGTNETPQMEFANNFVLTPEENRRHNNVMIAIPVVDANRLFRKTNNSLLFFFLQDEQENGRTRNCSLQQAQDLHS